MDSSSSSTPIGNITTKTPPAYDEGNRGLLVYLFGSLVPILGMCGNAFVIYLYLRSKILRNSLHKATMRAVLSLATTDLLTMVCLTITGTIFRLDVKMSYYVCLITISFPIYMTFVTQCVLGITTFDRYIAICHQQEYQKMVTKRSLNVMLALSWLMPLFLTIAPAFAFNHWNELQQCFLRYLYYRGIFICQSISFVILMIVTVGLYIPILVKAWEFHQKTYPAQFQGVNARTLRLRAKQRAFRHSFFIGLLTLIFMLCNMPLSIVRLHFGLGFSTSNTAFHLTFLFGIMKSVVNPFLYAWQQQLFRQEASKLIRCKCLKKENTNQLMLGDRQLVHIPLPRPRDSSRNPYPQDECNRAVEVRPTHASTSSQDTCSKTVKPKIIQVQPYQGSPIDETKL